MCLGDVPDTSSGPVPLTEAQVSALRLWLDGACEWDVPSNSPICGFGGVLFLGDQILAWGLELPRAEGKQWAERVGKKQLVFECELLPCLTSLQLWGTLLKSCDLMIFIDNDADRASLAKSFTRKEEGARIVFEAVEEEERLDVQAFFVRAPTSSNIADGPSKPPAQIVFLFGWGSFFDLVSQTAET